MQKSEIYRFHYGYIIVLCGCLIMGLNVGLTMSCAGIFYQSVSNELNVSVGKLGIYMSFNFLASTLILPIAGKLIEKYSLRWLLTLSSTISGLTLLGMGFFNSLWQFYVAGCVQGGTLAFLMYLSYPILINRWFNIRVGFFVGLCSAASGIGGVLFSPASAWLITNCGWRMAYIVFGMVILLVGTPLLGLLLRDRPSDKGLSPYGHTEKREIIQKTDGIAYEQAAKMPIFYGMILFAFLMLSVSTLNWFFPDYVSTLGYTLEQSSFVASAVMVGVTVGKGLLGMINDKNCIAGVLITTLCGIIGLGFLLMHIGLPVLIFGGFLFGWAYAGVTVQTIMLVHQAFGNKDYTKIYSIVSVAFAIGGAISAGGWGLLADATSYGFIFIMGIIFLVLSGSIGLFALYIRRKNMRRQAA